MDYMENKCRCGYFCVLQHPVTTKTTLTSASAPPIYPTPSSSTSFFSRTPPTTSQHQQPQFHFLSNPTQPSVNPAPLQYNMARPMSVPVLSQSLLQMAGYHQAGTGPLSGQRGPRPVRSPHPYQQGSQSAPRPQTYFQQPNQNMTFRPQSSPSQTTQQQGFW